MFFAKEIEVSSGEQNPDSDDGPIARSVCITVQHMKKGPR